MTAVDPTRAPAVLLMDAAECEKRGEGWHALRDEGIGGSEIGIIVLKGTPWGSPFDLFYRKRNGWRIPDNKDMKVGRRLENALCHEEFVERHAGGGEDCPTCMAGPPYMTIVPMDRGGMYRHPTRTWQRVTLDATASDGGGPPIAVEYKVVRSWDDWGPDGSDEIPVMYRCQLLWAMDVLNSTPGYLLAFNPSDRTYREYVIPYDAKDVRVMVEMAERFLRRLADDDPPDIDDSAHTLRTLKRLHPDLVDGKVEVPAELADGYHRAKAAVDRAEALYRRYENRVRAEIGPVKRAVHNGQSVAVRSVFINQHGTTTDTLHPSRRRVTP